MFISTDLPTLLETKGQDREALINRTLEEVQKIQEQFKKVFGIEGGFMISDSLDFSKSSYFHPHMMDLQHKGKVQLAPGIIDLLLLYNTCKNSMASNTADTSNNISPSPALSARSTLLSTLAWPLTECQSYGTWFRRAIPRHGISNPSYYTPPHVHSYVWFFSPLLRQETASIITDMFAIERSGLNTAAEIGLTIYLVVRRFKELNPEDLAHDPW